MTPPMIMPAILTCVERPSPLGDLLNLALGLILLGLGWVLLGQWRAKR